MDGSADESQRPTLSSYCPGVRERGSPPYVSGDQRAAGSAWTPVDHFKKDNAYDYRPSGKVSAELPNNRVVVVGTVVGGLKQAGSAVLPSRSAGAGQASESAPEPKNLGGLDILLSTISSHVLQDDGSAAIKRGYEGSSSFENGYSLSGRKRKYEDDADSAIRILHAVNKQKKMKQICEQHRRDALKEGLETLKAMTSDFLVQKRVSRRGPTQMKILKVALVRLRLTKGLPPFPDHMLLEDSNFIAMPAAFIKPECKITENGFEIPPGGIPKDKLGIQRMENKQRGERRRRNLQRLENELVAMCVPKILRTAIRKTDAFDCIARCLRALPPVPLAEKIRISSIIENSHVVIPKKMGKPVPLAEPEFS